MTQAICFHSPYFNHWAVFLAISQARKNLLWKTHPDQKLVESVDVKSLNNVGLDVLSYRFSLNYKIPVNL